MTRLDAALLVVLVLVLVGSALADPRDYERCRDAGLGRGDCIALALVRPSAIPMVQP